jgi:hypothetical protein
VSGLRKAKVLQQISGFVGSASLLLDPEFFLCEGSLWICYYSGADPLSRKVVVGVAHFLSGVGADGIIKPRDAFFPFVALQRDISCATQAPRVNLNATTLAYALVS